MIIGWDGARDAPPKCHPIIGFMRITQQGKDLVNNIMAKNAVIKAKRKESAFNSACHVADCEVDDHFKYRKRGAMSMTVKTWQDRKKCYTNGCKGEPKHRLFLAMLCEKCFNKEKGANHVDQ